MSPIEPELDSDERPRLSRPQRAGWEGRGGQVLLVTLGVGLATVLLALPVAAGVYAGVNLWAALVLGEVLENLEVAGLDRFTVGYVLAGVGNTAGLIGAVVWHRRRRLDGLPLARRFVPFFSWYLLGIGAVAARLAFDLPVPRMLCTAVVLGVEQLLSYLLPVWLLVWVVRRAHQAWLVGVFSVRTGWRILAPAWGLALGGAALSGSLLYAVVEGFDLDPEALLALDRSPSTSWLENGRRHLEVAGAVVRSPADRAAQRAAGELRYSASAPVRSSRSAFASVSTPARSFAECAETLDRPEASGRSPRQQAEEWLCRRRQVCDGDAFDLASDVMLDVCEAHADAEHLPSYFMRSVQNRAVDAYRKARRAQLRLMRLAAEQAMPADEAPEGAASPAELAILESALGALSTEDAALLRSRYRSDWSSAQVAARFGVSAETLRKRLERARVRLKDELVRRAPRD